MNNLLTLWQCPGLLPRTMVLIPGGRPLTLRMAKHVSQNQGSSTYSGEVGISFPSGTTRQLVMPEPHLRILLQ
jgi:hypothetical protein